MKNYKLYKNTSKRISALVMAGVLFVSGGVFTGCGCSKKEDNKNTTNVKVENTMINEYDYTKGGITKLFPTMNSDIVNNASLIILLDEIAKEDENGKIKANVISNYKAKIDTDNMMDDFNSFLDTLEQAMIEEGKVIETSNIVSQNDSEILANIESITQNIITGDKEVKKNNFDIIYKLFVEEDKVNVNGLEFEIRDLSYAGRAIAEAYARTSAYYARDYITEEQYQKIDKRTNAQNNKAYIKTKLEILNNQMDEKSQIDVIKAFNHEYKETKANLDGKITVDTVNLENLVNVLNLEYLDSDKVSTKDKNTILGEYNEENVSNVLVTIDAVNKYNQNNQNNIILLSSMIVDDYANTETGKLDKIALDYIQFNTIMLLNTTTTESSFEQIYSNPYFENIYKCLTKQNMTHKYSDGTEVTINYQEISNSAKIAINETIIYVINERTNIKNGKGFEEKGNSNLKESIQYIQNTITGECEKVDVIEFVK